VPAVPNFLVYSALVSTGLQIVIVNLRSITGTSQSVPEDVMSLPGTVHTPGL